MCFYILLYILLERGGGGGKEEEGGEEDEKEQERERGDGGGEERKGRKKRCRKVNLERKLQGLHRREWRFKDEGQLGYTIITGGLVHSTAIDADRGRVLPVVNYHKLPQEENVT